MPNLLINKSCRALLGQNFSNANYWQLEYSWRQDQQARPLGIFEFLAHSAKQTRQCQRLSPHTPHLSFQTIPFTEHERGCADTLLERLPFLLYQHACPKGFLPLLAFSRLSSPPAPNPFCPFPSSLPFSGHATSKADIAFGSSSCPGQPSSMKLLPAMLRPL